METVLVTGANRGIGLELTRQFLEAGYRVVAGCRNPEGADSLSALGTNSNLSIHSLDVTSGESVAALCVSLEGQSIDILINNAGVMGGPRQDVGNMDYDAWMEAFEVNTLAPFRLTDALRDNLIGTERPRVITLSSQMGSLNRQSRGAIAYRSSKAAVNKVMQVLSLELEQDGIIVCPVHPGWVQTSMGGQHADISPEESASGLVKLIESLTKEQSGRFWTWDGQEHPW